MAERKKKSLPNRHVFSDEELEMPVSLPAWGWPITVDLMKFICSLKRKCSSELSLIEWLHRLALTKIDGVGQSSWRRKTAVTDSHYRATAYITRRNKRLKCWRTWIQLSTMGPRIEREWGKVMWYYRLMELTWKMQTTRRWLISSRAVIAECEWWCCLRTAWGRLNFTFDTFSCRRSCRIKWESWKEFAWRRKNCSRENGRLTACQRERKLPTLAWLTLKQFPLTPNQPHCHTLGLCLQKTSRSLPSRTAPSFPLQHNSFWRIR